MARALKVERVPVSFLLPTMLDRFSGQQQSEEYMMVTSCSHHASSVLEHVLHVVAVMCIYPRLLLFGTSGKTSIYDVMYDVGRVKIVRDSECGPVASLRGEHLPCWLMASSIQLPLDSQ